MFYSTIRHCVWKAAETLFNGDTKECLTATALYDDAPSEIEKVSVLNEYISKLESLDTDRARSTIKYIYSVAGIDG